MNKTKTKNGAALLGLLLGMTGCAGGKTTGDAVQAAPVSEREVSSLFEREPGGTLGDYRAETQTVRLLGVQGEGAEAFATVMDTVTFHTRNIPVGSLLGRNLKLSGLSLEGAEFAGSGGELSRARVGDPVTLRLVRHRFDDVRTDLGKHRFILQSQLLAEIHATYGAGAQTSRETLLPIPALKLSRVDPKGALARIGFEEGDWVFSVDAVDVSNDDAAGLFARFAARTPGPVLVTVYRSGTSQTLSYQLE